MTQAPVATSSRRFIKELKAPEFVRGIFSIANTQMGQTRQGKPYLRCLLGDRGDWRQRTAGQRVSGQ